MTIQDAMKIIELSKAWQTDSTSMSMIFTGIRSDGDYVFGQRRRAAIEASRTIALAAGENINDSRRSS